MQLTEELGDRQGLAWCHHELAHLDRLNGDLTAARDHLTKALDINRDLSNQDGITAAETYLGTVLHAVGETEQARDPCETRCALPGKRKIAGRKPRPSTTSAHSSETAATTPPRARCWIRPWPSISTPAIARARRNAISTWRRSTG